MPRRYRRTRRQLKRRWNAPDRDSPCSPTGRDWIAEQPGTLLHGRMGNPGQASKPTWARTRKRTTRSVRHWHGRWKLQRGDKLCRSESSSSPMPKPPSGEWHRRNQDRVRSTQSWHESTSQHYGARDQTSPSRSGGAPPPRAFPGMRRQTSGRSSRQKIRMRGEWSRSQGLLHTSSEKSRRRNGRKLASGLEAGLPRQRTRCRPGRNQTEWSRVAPRGMPQGSTN